MCGSPASSVVRRRLPLLGIFRSSGLLVAFSVSVPFFSLISSLAVGSLVVSSVFGDLSSP